MIMDGRGKVGESGGEGGREWRDDGGVEEGRWGSRGGKVGESGGGEGRWGKVGGEWRREDEGVEEGRWGE